MKAKQKMMPCLWFDMCAEEAVNFYLSIFEDGEILDVLTHPEGGMGRAGAVLSLSFKINGQELIALNGGPMFQFNQAVSFFVNCESQEEVDRLWDRLTADGGAPGQCGWLKDKYGLSWQIIPQRMADLMQDSDPLKVARVMQALFQMTKIDIAKLNEAYHQ